MGQGLPADSSAHAPRFRPLRGRVVVEGPSPSLEGGAEAGNLVLTFHTLRPTCARGLGLGPAHLCAQENPMSHPKPLPWPFISDEGGKASLSLERRWVGSRAKVTSPLP